MKMSSKEIILLIGVSLAAFVGNADFGIVNTALPAIQTSMQLTFVQAQWVANAFMLSISSFMLISGKIADLLGRKRMFYVGLVIFLAASAMAGAAINGAMLIWARALLAVGSAIMFTSSGSLVAVSFTDKARAKAMGVYWGVAMLGIAIGPVLGGVITQLINWRWIFFVNFPMIAISIVLCVLTLPKKTEHTTSEKVDWLGAVLFAIFAITFNLGVIAFTHIPVVVHQLLMYFVIAFIALLLLIWRELRYEHPLIKISLFKQSRFTNNLILTFCLGAFFGVIFFIFPIYLNNVQQLSVLNVGLFMLPSTILLAVISTYIGRIIAKGFSIDRCIMLGFLFLCISSIVSLTIGASSSLWWVSVPLLTLGIGWGLLNNPLSIVALEAGPESMSGVILGILWTVLNLGASCAIAISTAIFHKRAATTLLHELTSFNISVSQQAWINKVISDPKHALLILQQHTHLWSSTLKIIFHNYFMQGFHGMYLFLLFLAMIGLIVASLILLRDKYSSKV